MKHRLHQPSTWTNLAAIVWPEQMLYRTIKRKAHAPGLSFWASNILWYFVVILIFFFAFIVLVLVIFLFLVIFPFLPIRICRFSPVFILTFLCLMCG
jgi:hypothetical protein